MTARDRALVGSLLGTNNGFDEFARFRMAHTLTLAEVAIALVVAAHAGVLAVRLAVTLHQS